MLSREEEQDTAGIILQLSVCSKTVANAERAGIGVNLLKQSGGMPYGGNYDMRHGRWHGRSNCRKKGNPAHNNESQHVCFNKTPRLALL